jgi:hypothetical protein
MPVAPPPSAGTAREVEAFQNPPPKAVPAPPAPTPPLDLSREAPGLDAPFSKRWDSMQLPLGDEMRKGGEQITGQAILLFDVEHVADAAGTQPGPAFTVQLVLGMKPPWRRGARPYFSSFFGRYAY